MTRKPSRSNCSRSAAAGAAMVLVASVINHSVLFLLMKDLRKSLGA
jgi:hypothetical protein